MTPLNLEKSPLAAGGDLASTYVSMSEDEAGDLVRSEFAIDGQLTRLITEKGDTFRVDAIDGRRYVLKVANPSGSPMEIAFQSELLLHVEKADPPV